MRVCLVLAAATVTGCASLGGTGQPFRPPCFPACAAPEPNLPERGVLMADAPLIGAELSAAPLRTSPAQGRYVLMTAEECQCLAVERAVTAHLVDIERQLALASVPPRPDSRMSRGLRVQQQLLGLRATQIRNDAAGEALEAFYQLAAAEASLDVLDKSLAHARTMVGYLDELRRQGLPAPARDSELHQQELDLMGRRAELEWTVTQLNGRLRLLVGLCLEGSVRIWPNADLIVGGEGLDAHQAVHAGLASRADLAILRLLSATLDEATLPIVRGALQSRDAALGNVTSGSAPLERLLQPARGEDELQARRAQLSALLVESERELIVTIQAAAGAVEMRRDQAMLAKRSLEIARERLGELQQLRGVGQATPFDVAAQEGEVLEAERHLVQKAAEWRIAQVQLRRAIGVLAHECGFATPPGSYGANQVHCPTVPASWDGGHPPLSFEPR